MGVCKMEMSLDIQGIDTVIRKLTDVSVTVDRGINTVLRDSSEVYVDALRHNTPLGRKPLDKKKYPVRAREHVVRSNVVRKDGERIVRVGYTSKVAWYMWFLEKGTYSKGNPEGIAPRHQTERAFEDVKEEIANVQKHGLKDLLKRYVT